jgi:DNA-directed RNA polymerase subunit RPC12/RpoP
MPRKQITVWVCSRCGHEWKGDARTAGKPPVRCASCRSPGWNKPTLTPEQRSEIAKNASAARWSKKKMRNRTTKRAKKGTESK